jgi:hypothetical protein
MEYTNFTRIPFGIEAVLITEDNIEECAAMLGTYTPPEDGDPPVEGYILVDRRIVPNMRRAHVGWWITRMDDRIRCYAPEIFVQHFEPSVSPEPDFNWQTAPMTHEHAITLGFTV